jgi:hypothetical protein
MAGETLTSVITCPRCSFQRSVLMPTNACVIAYWCAGCGVLLTPAPGDCCVYCTYGSVPCPQPPPAGSALSQ